jgi:hypothetical protein
LADGRRALEASDHGAWRPSRQTRRRHAGSVAGLWPSTIGGGQLGDRKDSAAGRALGGCRLGR